jgi:hypothetical protein
MAKTGSVFFDGDDGEATIDWYPTADVSQAVTTGIIRITERHGRLCVAIFSTLGPRNSDKKVAEVYLTIPAENKRGW